MKSSVLRLCAVLFAFFITVQLYAGFGGARAGGFSSGARASIGSSFGGARASARPATIYRSTPSSSYSGASSFGRYTAPSSSAASVVHTNNYYGGGGGGFFSGYLWGSLMHQPYYAGVPGGGYVATPVTVFDTIAIWCFLAAVLLLVAGLLYSVFRDV